jgi:hypothetical protein
MTSVNRAGATQVSGIDAADALIKFYMHPAAWPQDKDLDAICQKLH